MKTMNFLSMAALAMVGAMTAGCSSDDNIIDQPQQPENKNNVVTLTTTVGFDEATGGTTRALDINYTDKKLTKTFAVGDQIAVVYENTGSTLDKVESVALTAGDISADGKSATFTVTLTDPKASGSVKYIYPAAMAGTNDVDYTKLNSQDGTLATIASNYDLATYSGTLTAEATLPASPTLENELAIIAYTLKDADGTNDITSTITGMSVSDGTNDYAISGYDTDGHIYAAIQPTSGANIEYTATDGSKNYTKSVTSKTYAAGEFYQLGLKMAEASSVPEGAISGLFSVSSTNKVWFSKGNLQYVGSWQFATNQWDYFGDSQSDDHRDLFGYGTGTTPNTITNNNSDYSTFTDWGNNAITNGGNTAGLWRTLTKDEWVYLFVSRNGGTTSNADANDWWGYAMVNGVAGIVILPDNPTVSLTKSAKAAGRTTWYYSTWTGGSSVYTDNEYSSSTTPTWEAMEEAGAVFLPAAGFRSGSTFYYAGTDGYYWSASSAGTDKAYYITFSSTDLYLELNSNRYSGRSVRLVRAAE